MIMKKTQFVLAVIAMIALASCQREKDIVTPEVGENGLAFILQGAPLTRSSENLGTPQKTSIPVDVEGVDEQFYLEETVEDLNAGYAPATKGTPAYTENVGVLYANQLFVHAAGKFGDATYASMDKEMVDGGWRFQHNYDGDPWPGETTPVDFYLRMPATMNGVTELNYDKTGNKPTISFSYTSPETTAGQQDILFAARPASKQDYLKSLPGGIPVLFHHALTAVKFRIVNNDETTNGKDGHTQTYITKVTLKGLINKGTCVVTPRQETNGYVDDRTGDYSSGDETTVVWTRDETSTGTFSQEYTEAQNITKFDSSNSSDKPASFYAVANTNNLNDDAASMTFWFIPQTLTNKVTMEVEFHVWDGSTNQKTKTLKVNFGELALAKTNAALATEWKAGELRTFSLKPLDVNVDITDKIDKYVKSDVVIKNTGNVTQYVRVYLIGNWVGKRQIKAGEYNTDDTILMGYTTEKGEDEVLRWNDKDFTGSAAQPVYEKWTSPGGKEYTYTPYGTFVGLPPMGTATAGGTKVNDWVRHDKFYYYTQPIGPGDNVPDSKPLFTRYTVDENKIPDFWITDNTGLNRLLAKDVHLVMDIAVQAIETPMDEHGNPTKTYDKAWADALGVTIEGLNDL